MLAAQHENPRSQPPGRSIPAPPHEVEPDRGIRRSVVRRQLVQDVRHRATISAPRRAPTAGAATAIEDFSLNVEELMERARRRGELLDRMLALTSTADHAEEIASAFELQHEPRAPPLADKGMRALRAACEVRLEHSLEDVCSICLSERRKGQRVLRLPGCAHIFHSSCVRTWLARSACCPSCRREITPPSGAALVHGGFRSAHALAALALPQS